MTSTINVCAMGIRYDKENNSLTRYLEVSCCELTVTAHCGITQKSLHMRCSPLEVRRVFLMEQICKI